MDWKTMNGLEKPFRKKNPIQKETKNSKNKSEIAACEQKNHQRESQFLFKHRFCSLL